MKTAEEIVEHLRAEIEECEAMASLHSEFEVIGFMKELLDWIKSDD